MKMIVFIASACLTLGAALAQQTFTGTITDTMSGAKHTMIKGQPDAQCVKACVQGSSGYALYNGKTVWKLSDQKTPVKFAAAKVTVTGVANDKTKTINVASIEAAR